MDARTRKWKLARAPLNLRNLRGPSGDSGNGGISARQTVGQRIKTPLTALVFSMLLLLAPLVIATALVVDSRSALAAGATSELRPLPDTTTNAAEEEHGLSQKADEITRILNFPITNSMVVTWIVAFILIAFVQYATRNMKPVPEGAQNFLEWLVEGLYKFIESIIGPHLTKRTFWFFATI